MITWFADLKAFKYKINSSALFENFIWIQRLRLHYRVFQKFVPIVNCILRKAFNASLGKCKLIQVRNLSK